MLQKKEVNFYNYEPKKKKPGYHIYVFLFMYRK